MENRVGGFSADETDKEMQECVIEASKQQGGSEGEAKFLAGDDALQPVCQSRSFLVIAYRSEELASFGLACLGCGFSQLGKLRRVAPLPSSLHAKNDSAASRNLHMANQAAHDRTAALFHG